MPENPKYLALIQLFRTVDLVWNRSRRFFQRWNVSPSQFNVLNVLFEHPSGITQVELSRALVVHRSNVTGLIDRLQSAGLVQRDDDPADRRIYRIQLTLAGRRQVQEILPEYHAAAERLLAQFSDPRARQFAKDLARIAANSERIAAELESPSPES